MNDDWGGLAVLPADDTDDGSLDDLLEGPASQTPSILPPLPEYVRRSGPPDFLDPADGWEPDSELRPAGNLFPPARTVITEAAAWKSDAHPRWPKGSGEHAGQFMHVGQYFTSGGTRWQIAHIVNGRIYAHEASAKYGSVQTKSFDTANEPGTGTVVPNVVQDLPAVPKGGKSGSTVTIVDPYVDSSTHDPSIPIPEHSDLTPEEWQRFGKLDQEHYSELMERFGKHKSGAAKAHVDGAYQQFSAKAAAAVKAAYSSQYGSSTGYTLSLTGGHIDANQAKLREEALALQAEHKAAVQWDLYNRARSPDVLAVHKSRSWSAEKWHEYAIAGNQPAFSGLSQSFCYRRTFFGKPGVVTPLAIRHVLLSSASAQPIPGQTKFASELEISVPDQMKLDTRSMVITSVPGGKHSLSATQMSWLEGMTNEPVGGHVVDQLRDGVEKGVYLPPPPKAASIVMDNAAGKTWVDPPDAAAKPEFGDVQLPKAGSAVNAGDLPKSLPWNQTNADGSPKAVTGDEAGAAAGQYFMGLKGTLYWIGHDPGVGGGYPFRIHKIENGQFNGENFAYNPDLPGYYLDASYEEPKAKPDELPQFHGHEWVPSTESKFLETFATGEKFKLNGTPYEVQGVGLNGQMKVMDLESGLTGKINGDYKSPWLEPYDGEAPTEFSGELHKFSEGDHVITPDFKGIVTGLGGDSDGVEVTPFGGNVDTDSKVYAPGSLTVVGAPKPTVGMTFSYSKPGGEAGERVKATVTKVLANGSIQANLKPGKVVIPKDEWEAWGKAAFDPGAHVIGSKVKLRDLKPGEKFHGSAGVNTMRPYEVVQQVKPSGGAKTVVRNLDTGEVSTLSAHKSYPTLDAKAEDVPALGSSKSTPVEVAGPHGVGPAWDPGKYTPSDTKLTVTQAREGTFLLNEKGSVLHVGPTENGKVQLTVVQSDGTLPVGHEMGAFADTEAYAPLTVMQLKGEGVMPDSAPGGAEPVQPLHAAATEFDPTAYLEGDLAKIGEMPGGTIFKTHSKTKGDTYYKLSDDGTQTTNLTTGKTYDAKPHWKATPLQAPAADQAMVDASTLKPGDTFKAPSASTTGQVASIDGDTMYVKAAGMGDVKGIPVKIADMGMVHKVDPVAKPEPDGVDAMVATMKPNESLVLHNGVAIHRVPAGWRVGDKVHGTSQEAAHAALGATPSAGNQHTVSPLGTNAKGKSFGELADGAEFSPAHGGIHYVKNGTYTAVPIMGGEMQGQDQEQSFNITDVPDDLHSEPATQATIGQLVTAKPDPGLSASLAWTGTKHGYVQKVRESDGAVQLHNGSLWHKPENVTVHDEHLPPFKAGDVLTQDVGNKGTFVQWDSGPGGKPVALVDVSGNMDLFQWDPQTITAADSPPPEGTQQGVPLASKVHTAVPYEQLAPGDVTTLKQLKPGDQFAPTDGGGGGDKWQLVSHPAVADPEGSGAIVTYVSPNGSPGTPFASALSPDETVFLHAKAADAAEVVVPPGPEPESLPDAVEAGLVGYTQDAGGPHVFTPIGLLPQHTVFEDAGGHVWKVKQAGASPIVSGGAQHYQADPTVKVKDLSQPSAPSHPYPDTAGSLGPTMGVSAEVSAAQADMVHNTDLPLGDLNVKMGDYFMVGDGTWAGEPQQVIGVSPETGWIDAQSVGDGSQHTFSPWTVPVQVSPGAYSGVPESVGVEPDSPAAPSLYTEQIPAGDLAPGTKYTMAPGSTIVYTASTDPGEGPLDHTLVYVQPADGPVEQPHTLPPAPTGDPATMPPVEGPNGFAPAAPVPPLADTLGVGELDPFQHPKGGIYTYPQVGETQPGQMFTDKSGVDYRVVEHGPSTTAYENVSTGEQFITPSNQRVKLTALPPDPGPQLKPVIADLVAKYGSLESVPKVALVGLQSTYASDGKTKNPRLNQLKFGDVVYDADGHVVTYLGSWANRALVLDGNTNQPRLADAGLRMAK